jgi:hypothetical protein
MKALHWKTFPLGADLDGSWTPGKSKLRTFNAMLDQEGPAHWSFRLELYS